MNFTRYQRDLMISQITSVVEAAPARSEVDREAATTIAPAIVDLAKDCNELEDRLNRALAVNEALQKVIRSISNDKDMSGGGPG